MDGKKLEWAGAPSARLADVLATAHCKVETHIAAHLTRKRREAPRSLW